MDATELHVYDLDGSLYDSPRLRADRPEWWFSAKSLRGFGPPGFDRKWILPVLYEARRSILAPHVKTALLTARPKHREMEDIIYQMMHCGTLRFDYVSLKPLWPLRATAKYKAVAILDWLAANPRVTRVVFYDDVPANLEAVRNAMSFLRDIEYVPVQAPGVT